MSYVSPATNAKRARERQERRAANAKRPITISHWASAVPLANNPIFLRDLDLLHLRCKVIMASQAKPRGAGRPAR